MTGKHPSVASEKRLKEALKKESHKFEMSFRWLEKSMPAEFFEEVDLEQVILIAHNMISFELQNHFTTINLENAAIVLCLNSPDADLRILENYSMHGIRNYRAYLSTNLFPNAKIPAPLRVAVIDFIEKRPDSEAPYPKEEKENLRDLVKQRNPKVSDEEFDRLIAGMNTRLLHALPTDRLILALDMFFRAKTRDNCQYEVRYNEDWAEKDLPSMQILFAWRNTPKQNFLYRIAQVIHRHNLVMTRVNAAYVDPYSRQNILIMALEIHGSQGQAAWDAADIVEFMRELVTVKYFSEEDMIRRYLVDSGYIDGNEGNLLRAMVNFIHQALINIDINLYRIEQIEEALCRHPDLTIKICELFKLKFMPDRVNIELYEEERQKLLKLIHKLDTGHEENDIRRKNVLLQAINFTQYCLKTNFYRRNYTAISFRIDPRYLDEIPFNRHKRYPELPYAIFYIRGMHFFAFHIRFKDLARGGLRTVFPMQTEKMIVERNNVFRECYNLAYTQQKKNKDIPEGGSKGVIFLYPYHQLEVEKEILRRELAHAGMPFNEINEKLKGFHKEETEEYVFHAQRSFIESLITIVNCEPDGRIKAKYMVDYWKRPEYIYLGPDERMSNAMIEWIANFSKKYEYKPGGAFISSKPSLGINHKEYGVTSFGVNVYAHEVLKYLGIDPLKDSFTVKISGGPDGDVAGNQIKNLQQFYPNTAKLVALTDVSGTIYDPEGLDLNILVNLFNEAQAIRFYPPEMLHDGGFLLDKEIKKDVSDLITQTLCYRKKNGEVVKDWLSGSDMNYLLRHSLHQIKSDIFIPAGGRPRTLNKSNYHDFLDEKGVPSSRAIVEGANLYLTDDARHKLEDLGTLIFKDSSANKGGVICSSFEVLTGLVLTDKQFLHHKEQVVTEILDRIGSCAFNEAQLLLYTHKQTGQRLTEISDIVSNRINRYTYEILDYLEPQTLSDDPEDPLIRCFLSYCLPTLRNLFQDELIQEVPDHHKKAIVSSHIASQIVYNKGVDWSPSIVDILPTVWKDPQIVSSCPVHPKLKHK